MAPPTVPLARVLSVLALGQVMAWGSTFYLPAVLGRQMAEDLGIGRTQVYGGITVMLVAMAVGSPFLARLMARFEAARVMAMGAGLVAMGVGALALADGLAGYIGAWVLIGGAGTLILTTPAQVVLSQVAGAGARRAIGAMMLVSGLSGAIALPVVAMLADAFGWRGAVACCAALMLFGAVPLHLWGLPSAALPAVPGRSAADRAARGPAFVLIAAAGALSGFVSWGLAVVMIELLRARGLAEAEAVGLGALLGLVQVGARGADFLSGPRWDGLSTGLVAMVLMPLGFLALLFGSGFSAAAAFVLLYGLGSGAMTVARATIPLVFYSGPGYARAAGRIALPLNLAFAAAPPALGALMTAGGPEAVLVLAFAAAVVALGCLVALQRLRPQAAARVGAKRP